MYPTEQLNMQRGVSEEGVGRLQCWTPHQLTLNSGVMTRRLVMPCHGHHITTCLL